MAAQRKPKKQEYCNNDGTGRSCKVEGKCHDYLYKREKKQWKNDKSDFSPSLLSKDTVEYLEVKAGLEQPLQKNAADVRH